MNPLFNEREAGANPRYKAKAMALTMKSITPIHVREVWAENLVAEFSLIKEAISSFSFVSLDTEFPGTLFLSNLDKSLLSQAPPSHNYRLMKCNVDILKIIQLGMTLSDSQGNLPSFGTEFHYVWQFNFRDFNIQHDPYNDESIGLLERQGIDLKKNREKGLDSSDFAWIGLRGGLERVAKLLGVERTTGRRHQAGSDSLLTQQTFVRFKDSCANLDLENLNGCEGMIFGLCEGWLGFDRRPEVYNFETSTRLKPQFKEVFSV
ncbi:PREDICTED: probable CCR4-associated factor 1 homolog 9 [Populus euphratica]|uniref:poly(A)-specific ribonuclease n=1 Tax=Populus euphratica TaxID=75702 RepID=A0AAJ6U0Z6_POPEU|nr:PREDICTED: probable CCR4-associated factor 1 homolog 9 [Populus euphratica]